MISDPSPFPSIQPPFQTLSLFTIPAGEDQLFIVRKNANAAAQTPGGYESVVGFWPYDLGVGEVTMIPVVPEASRRAGEILAPSPEWCTHANLTCAGETFDARLPLENELSTDHTDIENSWQYWLSLAREAANESDRLAELVISEGLANDLRAESAAAELEELCGGSVDLDALLSDDLTDARGGDCSSSACAVGYICEQGECIRDPLLVLEDLAASGESDGAARLVECLGSDQVADYVALGANPICFWRSDTAPNDICGDAAGRDCPVVVSDPSATDCSEFDPAPGGHTWVFVGERLGYFESDAPGSTQVLAPPPCDALRTVRNPSNPLTLGLAMELTNGYFEATSMHRAASRVGWEARIHDYSTLTLDRRPWGLTTGDTYTGPATAGYPCVGQAGDPTCSAHGEAGDPLFGCVVDCVDPDERARVNDRMLRAAAIAREVQSLGWRGFVLPLPYASTTGAGIPSSRASSLGEILSRRPVNYDGGFPERQPSSSLNVSDQTGTDRYWEYVGTFRTGFDDHDGIEDFVPLEGPVTGAGLGVLLADASIIDLDRGEVAHPGLRVLGEIGCCAHHR